MSARSLKSTGLWRGPLNHGLTVIVVSTDFEEVAHICHRALVFSRGVIVAEIAERALTTQSLIHAASASEAA